MLSEKNTIPEESNNRERTEGKVWDPSGFPGQPLPLLLGVFWQCLKDRDHGTGFFFFFFFAGGGGIYTICHYFLLSILINKPTLRCSHGLGDTAPLLLLLGLYTYPLPIPCVHPKATMIPEPQ